MSDEELIQTLNESECEEDQEDDQGGDDPDYNVNEKGNKKKNNPESIESSALKLWAVKKFEKFYKGGKNSASRLIFLFQSSASVRWTVQAFYGHFGQHQEDKIREYVENLFSKGDKEHLWGCDDVDFNFLKEVHYEAMRQGMLAKNQSLWIIKLARKMLEGESFADVISLIDLDLAIQFDLFSSHHCFQGHIDILFMMQIREQRRHLRRLGLLELHVKQDQ
jgi:hypothetical protein